MAAGLSPALTLDRGISEVVCYVEKKNVSHVSCRLYNTSSASAIN